MAVIADNCPDISVTVIDMDEARIEAWNSGSSLPIFEPGLQEIISRTLGRNLRFVSQKEGAQAIAEADAIFIAVNTPTKLEGEGAGKASDLRYVESCAQFISEHASGHTIVVEKSTMPVRAADKVKLILSGNKSGATFDVVSNPEFMAEGTAVRDLETPDRVLIGGESKDPVSALWQVYSRWVAPDRIILTGLWSAELSKLAANAFLAQRVSSINALSSLCEVVGADVNSVSRAIGMDSRIGPKFLRASVGFGGSCFKKDLLCLIYLCEFYGVPEAASYWQSVVDLNEWQKLRFARMASDHAKAGHGVVAVLGLAFKKDTDDFRESPAISICNHLLSAGVRLRLHDERVDIFKFGNTIAGEACQGWTFCDDVNQAVKGADAILVLTDWDLYSDLDWQSISLTTSPGAAIFDGRNIVNHKRAREAGFPVFVVGQGK
jgi:UDPglucose 6-dehydrogenase